MTARDEQRTGRVLLVGESNPYGDDSRFALHPSPPGCAGHRLAHHILGMEDREYLAVFDRINLLSSRAPWSTRRARRAALILLCAPQRIVALGARVTRAFLGQPAETFQAYWVEGPNGRSRVVSLPHPSGRCRLWNAPGAVPAARALVAELRALDLEHDGRAP